VPLGASSYGGGLPGPRQRGLAKQLADAQVAAADAAVVAAVYDANLAAKRALAAAARKDALAAVLARS